MGSCHLHCSKAHLLRFAVRRVLASKELSVSRESRRLASVKLPSNFYELGNKPSDEARLTEHSMKTGVSIASFVKDGGRLKVIRKVSRLSG